MQVDLSPVAASETPSACLHAITFTLISGNIRRFRRICEHIQSMVSIYKEYSPDNCKTSEYVRISKRHLLGPTHIVVDLKPLHLLLTLSVVTTFSQIRFVRLAVVHPPPPHAPSGDPRKVLR